MYILSIYILAFCLDLASRIVNGQLASKYIHLPKMILILDKLILQHRCGIANYSNTLFRLGNA